MKTYIQAGDSLTIPAPTDTHSDDPVSVGAIFGFASYWETCWIAAPTC